MAIHHDGMTETTLPIFIIPNPDDTQQTRETEGLINMFRVAVANILNGIQNTIYKDARAQSVQDNIDTLIRTGRCIQCDLVGANLFRANLIEADLRLANLFGANLSGAI